MSDWLRILAGGLFFAWFGAVVYGGWKLTRPWKLDGKTEYGALDPNSEEFRRLIMK